MDLFKKALAQPNSFPSGLFWTSIKGAPVLPAVTELITAAQTRGVTAHVVEIETFDTLLLRLWRNLSDKPEKLDAKVRRSTPVQVQIALPASGTIKPLLRLNALPIRSLPSKCLVVRVKRALEWSDLRDLQRAAESRLIMTKTNEIWCWGLRAELRQVFGDNLLEIAERDIPTDLTAPENLHSKGFFENVLAAALARGRPLLWRNRRSSAVLIADPHAEDKMPLEPLFRTVGKLSGSIPGLFAPATDRHPEPTKVSWAEAVRVSIVQKRGETWAILDPDIWIWPPRAHEVATDFLGQHRKGRFNDKFNVILDAWVQVLIGSGERKIDVTACAFDSDDPVGNPVFCLGSQTAFAYRLQA